ncbi:hypothetical protein KPSA3_03838 [Pseudomonas syringae pv. actinidiae]|uniref:Uncharacterized protein n=1 Tax=Pseudomonas syringae pv. actinidiae TaxID=103796 RepID=A0AAN4Q5U8_PSESF|nr:hypothetical protein KPSA3_03838 [Pseudomonas syringae pv. actinidiae]
MAGSGLAVEAAHATGTDQTKAENFFAHEITLFNCCSIISRL